MPKLHSFDVFDTCLIRAYAFPTDVFLTLAGEFQATLEPLLGQDYRVIFRDSRADAEARALAAANGEETTLREIWVVLASMLPGLDVDLGIERELTAERNALHANTCVRERVRRSREQHGRVLFVSDTYLPEHFVREILTEHDFLEKGDGCYVSSALGLTKRTGSLFRHVLEVEAVSSRDLIHFGDNKTSDYSVPKGLGITAERFADIEHSWVEKAVLEHAHHADTEFASRLAGEMRRFRLSGVGSKDEAAKHFVASFLGPLLFVIASWMLARAQKDGVKRLYFFSRDCYALWQVASKLVHRFADIDCRYLQVSRQALYLPTTTEISPQGMPWMRRSFEQMRLGRLLGKLELDVASAGPAFVEWAGQSGDDYELVSDSDWDRFWVLLNQEPLRSRIVAAVNERRWAAIQYFRAQGLFDYREVAVVDLGWFLTCQGALRDLLRLEDPAANVRGYYLGLHLNRRAVEESGLAHAMFYAAPSDRSSILGSAEVFKRVAVLEHVLGCAPHGTVHHFQRNPGQGIGVVSCGQTDDEQVFTSRELVELTLHFSENAKLLTSLLPNDVQPIVDQLICQATNNPEPSWSKLVGNIRTSEDQNNIASVTLAYPLSWIEFLLTLFPAGFRPRNQGEVRRRVWPELSHAASSRYLITAMHIRRFGAAVFHRLIKIPKKKVLSNRTLRAANRWH